MTAQSTQLWQHPQQAASSPALTAENERKIPGRMNLRRLQSSNANPGSKQAGLLLESLSSRLNEEYRRIEFIPDRTRMSSYEQRVSFDTINIEYNEDDSAFEFLDDEMYLLDPGNRARRLSTEGDFRGRGRDRDLFGTRSPSSSPTRILSPLRGVDMTLLFSLNQIPYPLKPIITRKGCTITKMHKDFENLYLGNLLGKGQWPVLPGRVILVYVSGRIHTWVSIDWILRSFIQHGDTVVIVSSLPHSLSAPSTKLSKYSSPAKYPPKTERMRMRQRSHPEYIKQVALNVMKYALSVVNPGIIIKIIVEIAEGKTKDVLKDMYKLYEPNVVSTGSKNNTRNSAPLKSWNSSRLSDRLVKNFPLPVIVVPALNMSHFEKKLSASILEKANVAVFEEKMNPKLPTHLLHTEETVDSSFKLSNTNHSVTSLSSRSSGSPAITPGKMPIAYFSNNAINDALYSSDDESFSDESVTSDVSANSESSLESATSFNEIANLYEEYQHEVQNNLNNLASANVDENYFSNFIKLISDLSLRFCEDLRSVNPSFKGQGAKLARVITGSNTFGAVPYKTKSLLPPIEPEKSESNSNTGISITDLKKSLKLNAERARQNEEYKARSSSVPQIVIDSDNLTPPPSRSLKFKEDDRNSRLGLSRPLKKFLSHEDPSDSKLKIEPSKSHPDLRTLGVDEEKKVKKKKKKFWKLFSSQT